MRHFESGSHLRCSDHSARDSDAIVPFGASGKRAHEAVHGSELVVIEGGPHAIIASHVPQFNDTLLALLAR